MTKLATIAPAPASVALVSDADIKRYSREELQRYIAQAAIEVGLPGSAVKHTRVARALLRLAAMAEISAGYDKETFLKYAGEAFDKVAGTTSSKTATLSGTSSKPALKAKSSMGLGHAPAYAAVKKLGK